MDSDPWTKEYKQVIRNLEGIYSKRTVLAAIVDAIFQTHQLKMDEAVERPVAELSEHYLVVALSSMKNKRAPGPDVIPAEILKVIANSHSQLLLNAW